MKKILASLKEISETSINANLLKDTLNTFDFSEINYNEIISGYDLDKYNKIIIKEKPVQIFLVTWPAQVNLPIHQHIKYWGYTAVLEGMLTEYLYDYDKDSKVLSIHPSRNVKKGELIYEPLNIIHQLMNPSPLEIAVSLHFYYPSEYDYDGTLMFDIEKRKLAELNEKAPNVSWNHPKEYYKRQVDDAFEVTKLW